MGVCVRTARSLARPPQWGRGWGVSQRPCQRAAGATSGTGAGALGRGPGEGGGAALSGGGRGRAIRSCRSCGRWCGIEVADGARGLRGDALVVQLRQLPQNALSSARADAVFVRLCGGRRRGNGSRNTGGEMVSARPAGHSTCWLGGQGREGGATARLTPDREVPEGAGALRLQLGDHGWATRGRDASAERRATGRGGGDGSDDGLDAPGLGDDLLVAVCGRHGVIANGGRGGGGCRAIGAVACSKGRREGSLLARRRGPQPPPPARPTAPRWLRLSVGPMRKGDPSFHTACGAHR